MEPHSPHEWGAGRHLVTEPPPREAKEGLRAAPDAPTAALVMVLSGLMLSCTWGEAE